MEIYYKKHKDREPRPLAMRAISECEGKSRALDLGAAPFVESKALRDAGFKVVAVDNNPNAVDYIPDGIEFVKKNMKDVSFPEGSFDLINAQYSLPFLEDSNEVSSMIKKIIKMLAPQGVFVGTLFGLNDDWANKDDVVCLSKSDIDLLLPKSQRVLFREEEFDGKTALRSNKHWHVYSFIIKKS